MAICPKCAAENAEDARFCSSCGTALAIASPREEQRKTVTALFCDVTGSTALGERLDPETLRRVMSRYFEEARRVIERHGGTVEKFIGDAVMAVFGVPVLHEDDALRAVRAGHELRDSLGDLNVELDRTFGTSLEIRMGINTGEVVTVGDEMLATGDAVNVAARLEQAAAPGEILLGRETFGLTRDAVEAEQLEPLSLKGKSEPVPSFRLVSVREGAGAVRHREDVPMVGRERELRRLHESFSQATQDRSCQLFTVLGSAGVGKSRLVREFLSSLQNALILTGSCLSYGEGITYWPVLEVIKQLEPRLDVFLSDDRARVVIRSLLGEEETASSTEEIAWAFRKVLEAAAEEEPVVCVFDDVHWGEESFLDLIEHVADLSRGSPILVLCMGRPELLDRRPRWAGGKLNATTVLLEPLGEAEAELLVDELVGAEQVDQSLKSRIREAAEGNPFFCEQLVALAQQSEGHIITVPSTVQALLAARLDQLDPDERGILARGSIEGRVFHRGGVEALTPEEPQVMARLTSLVRRDLIRPDRPQLPSEDAFRFRHLLIRDAAYEGLSKSTRSELHERFARWLSEHGLDLLELDEVLGYHLEQAYRYRAELGPLDDREIKLGTEAGEHLAVAGRRALDRGDVTAAVNLLGRAVELVPDAERDVGIDLDYAESLFSSGKPEQGIDIAASAAQRAEANEDGTGSLKARLTEARIRLHVSPEGVTDDLRMLATEALPLFEGQGDQAGLAAAWVAVSSLEVEFGSFAACARAGKQALEQARADHDYRYERQALTATALGLFWGPAPVREALLWFHDQEESSVSHPLLAVLQSGLVAMAGDFEKARKMADGSRDRLRELGMSLELAISSQARTEVEVLAGDAEGAARVALEGCDLSIEMGERGFLSTLACQLAEALLLLGRDEEALAWAERGREEGATDDIATQALWRSVQARVLARRGDEAQAMDLMREALVLIAKTDMLSMHGDTLIANAQILDLAARPEEAIAARRKALALYRQKGNVVGAGWAEGALRAVPL